MDLERLEYSLDEGTSQSVCVLFSRQLQRPLSLSSDFEELRGLLRGETEVLFTLYIYTVIISPNNVCIVFPINRYMTGFFTLTHFLVWLVYMQYLILYSIIIIIYSPLPPLGEQRLGVPGPSYVIGVSANASNTVEPGSVCMSVDNVDDSVKEGNRLSLLRLNSSETAVMIGERQALFIETANDG